MSAHSLSFYAFFLSFLLSFMSREGVLILREFPHGGWGARGTYVKAHDWHWHVAWDLNKRAWGSPLPRRLLFFPETFSYLTCALMACHQTCRCLILDGEKWVLVEWDEIRITCPYFLQSTYFTWFTQENDHVSCRQSYAKVIILAKNVGSCLCLGKESIWVTCNVFAHVFLKGTSR
jgi:hypothetical protein